MIYKINLFTYFIFRLVRLTGLSREIIYGGEMLQVGNIKSSPYFWRIDKSIIHQSNVVLHQVVHYTTHGHYHAHHDSETHERNDVPCCHQYSGDTLGSTGECKICRWNNHFYLFQFKGNFLKHSVIFKCTTNYFVAHFLSSENNRIYYFRKIKVVRV